jgi:hypothetical protein
MAVVELMNEVNQMQNGKALSCGSSLNIILTSCVADRQHDVIYQWLSPPDYHSTHNAVSEKRQEQTGSWFIKEAQYVEWKTGSKSFLWLYGICMYSFDCPVTKF